MSLLLLRLHCFPMPWAFGVSEDHSDSGYMLFERPLARLVTLLSRPLARIGVSDL